MNFQEATELTISEGEVRTIHDSTGNQLWGKLNYSVKYNGDTLQQTSPSPSPSNPQDITNVTGEQIISITDGSVSKNFTLNLGALELCKIGEYQDYIYKSGDEWYVHKKCGKQVYTGASSENWQYGSGSSAPFRIAISNSNYYVDNNTPPNVYTNYYTAIDWTSIASSNYGVTAFNSAVLPFRNTDIVDLSAWKTWLGTHNLIVFYPLATPTETIITDTTLISQLESIEEWTTRYGYASSVTGDLPIIINQTTL